jgi:predicted ATPase/class 3 adenylate cyclase
MGGSLPHGGASVLDGSAITTLLFTDIEGSARLWECEPERMPLALARHDALARAAVEQHRGTVVKTTGDGVYAAFVDPIDGLGAAVQLQLALVDPNATEGLALRVRCGLHAGVVERRDNDYFGTAANRTARIMGAAHGGQVLLSEAVSALVADRLPPGLTLRDLGAVTLRDLARPERIHQLVHPQLEQEFAPLRSLKATPNNLPQQISTFVGRQRELTEARGLLAGARLLTVVGVGGIGKTRISLQIADDAQDTYPDGVWWVELAPIVDPELVPKTIAKALGLHQDPDTPLIDSISAFLRGRRSLLVLDNCEHLIGACATVADALLRAAPELRILASSRESLQIPGEQTYPLPSLSLPAVTAGSDEVARSDAVQLFVERARLKQPTFAVTARNSDAVAQVCARLDGIPLALELAAARVGVLPVESIAERLHDRFRLLVDGSRTVLPRQQTLRASIDWGYELLSEAEKMALGRLSVFVAGWTLPAAEAVLAGEGIAQDVVLDLLTGLVHKSLVIPDDSGERYRMLETIRQYASDRLQESGQWLAMGRRHRDWFLAFAEEAETHLNGGAEQPAWIARLDIEHDNLRAALTWSSEQVDGSEAALRLCGALYPYWGGRGYAAEGEAWCLKAMSRDATGQATKPRAKALIAAGTLAWRLGDMTRAQATLEEALDLSRHLGVRSLEADALASLGGVVTHRAEFPMARALLEQAVRLNGELGRRAQEADSYNSLAGLAISQGDDEAAKEPLERALAICRVSGSKLAEGRAIFYRAVLASRRDQYTAAQSMHEQALAIAREFGVREFELVTLRHLADVALNLGDMETARARYRNALIASRDLGNRHRIAEMLEAVMDPIAAAGEFQRAAMLAGAADALRSAVATPRGTLQQQQRDPIVSRCREALGEQACAAAIARGRTMSSDEVLSAALSWLAED